MERKEKFVIEQIEEVLNEMNSRIDDIKKNSAEYNLECEGLQKILYELEELNSKLKQLKN